MLSKNGAQAMGVQALALVLLAVGCLQAAQVQAQGFDLRSMCQAYPAGIQRAGCRHSMGTAQALAEAQQGKDGRAPRETAAVIATFSLQVTLALDETIRHWQSLSEWGWNAGAH